MDPAWMLAGHEKAKIFDGHDCVVRGGRKIVALWWTFYNLIMFMKYIHHSPLVWPLKTWTLDCHMLLRLLKDAWTSSVLFILLITKWLKAAPNPKQTTLVLQWPIAIVELSSQYSHAKSIFPNKDHPSKPDTLETWQKARSQAWQCQVCIQSSQKYTTFPY